jgi:DNA-binding LytR/AlgR family response regulator
MKYTCMITDDEPLAHSVLKEYIKSNEQLELVKQCYSAKESRDYLVNNKIDILFLDIEMPEETGISFLQSIQHKPITIFTTAYLNYTLEGFDLGVMDYLIKPIRAERFQLAVNRAIEFLKLQALQSKIEKENLINSQILIKTGTRKILIDRIAITHVQALKDYMIIYCGIQKYVVRSTMTEMVECLGHVGFLRVHKSFIVAKHKIQNLTSSGTEFDQFEIPVGRKYKAEVEEYLRSANI